MKLQDAINEFKQSPISGWYYIQGYVRLFLYSNKWTKWMIRKHIALQYEHRLISAEACVKAGSCLCCGCDTPALMFADKGCSVWKYSHCREDGLRPCYIKMLPAKDYEEYLIARSMAKSCGFKPKNSKWNNSHSKKGQSR